MSKVQETKELLKFVIDLGLAFEKSLDDGDLSVFDAANFISSMIDLGPAFSGIEKIPSELKNMVAEDAKEIRDFIKEHLDLAADQKVEEVIDRLSDIGVKLFELVCFIRDNKKQ